MSEKRANNLIVIEDGRLRQYQLDDRQSWEVGRISKGNVPDIGLHAATVSRKHGRFANVDGVWFYFDYNSKNGTVCNNRHIMPGFNNRIKPVLLNDGDVLIFGGGDVAVINEKTVWAMFTMRDFGGEWHTVNTGGLSEIKFLSGTEMVTIRDPKKGTVISQEGGYAIYMGDVTYLTGEMEVVR